MAEISIVDSRIVKKEDNFSSLFYKKEILDLLNILDSYIKKNGGFQLNNKHFIRKIETRTFHTYSSTYYTIEGKGYPLVQASSLNDYFLKINVYISKDFEDGFKKKFLFPKGSIFISRGGTIGLIGINYDYEYCSISQDVIGIYPNVEQIKSEVLFIFFLSSYGQALLSRCIVGRVQPHLELGKLKEITIPIFHSDFQSYIEQLVKQAYEKRKLAEKKYKKAEELLYQLLGISIEEIEKLEAKKVYETNFKEVKEAFRFDAEYYHPKYLGILELLKKVPFEVKPLKEVVKISNEKIDPTKEPYKAKRFKYVPIAKIDESGEIFEWEELFGWQAPSRARMVIRKGDILIPSLKGTFDKIALVPEELDGQLATTGCFVIRVKEGYPEFFFLLFRSTLFKRQLERLITGAIMSAVPKTVFGNLLVPVVPKDKQEEIANLIREYFELRKEARKLIQRAIQEVEKEIENASRTIGE